LTVDWEPERYHNTYLARVHELIESKRAGRAVVAKTPRPTSNVVDLMSALEASVARAGRPADRKAGVASTAKQPSRAQKKTAANNGQPLDELSKPELLRLASDHDIAGRSAMSKAELVQALTEAGASANGRGRRRAASA
jgi:DNA end-binding protein Ku